MDKSILITGGAGFIGSHLVRHFVLKYPNYQIYNFDSLTYAGNLSNLKDIENNPNYHFVKGDITDLNLVRKTLKTYQITDIIHLAAESHVDRSIKAPLLFAQVNVLGTLSLLQSATEYWSEKGLEGHRFYHVSTDEVYGALELIDAPFTEKTPYAPHSPYSASKASSDHFVRAYYDTYGLPIVISNCSNNFGPYQFPEKLIPLVINNIVNEKPLPIYGRGDNIRDWLYVVDHIEAIDLIFHKSENGKTYNIGGNCELQNIEIVRRLIQKVDSKLGRNNGYSEKLITYVTDRRGHDLRYAIDASLIKSDLSWQPRYSFDKAFDETIEWYLSHPDWLQDMTSGAYVHYYEDMYRNR